VCDLLRKLAALHLSVPITLFLDNARYQKCAVVLELACSLHIAWCFLPTYSPNLNLIERLWKFIKKDCLYSEYYADFASFQTAISESLSKTDTEHKSTLDSLLTLKFRLGHMSASLCFCGLRCEQFWVELPRDLDVF